MVKVRSFLEPLVPIVRDWLDREAQFMSGRIPGEQRVSVFPIAQKLAQDLRAISDFCVIADKFVLSDFGGGGSPVSPYLAVNLLHILAYQGIEHSVQWLDKIIHLETADAAQIQLIHGIKVDEPIAVTDTISLIPFRDIPDGRIKSSEIARSYWDRRRVFQIDRPPSSALIERVTVSPVFKDSIATAHQERNPRKTLARMANALALIRPSAVILGTAWMQYLDPEAHQMVFGHMGAPEDPEVRPKWMMDIDISACDLELLRVLAKLPEEFLSRIDLALERFAAATRRRGIGDQAVDACIALENLLGSGTRTGNITADLRKGTDLVLCSMSAKERKHYRNAVLRLYDLRSRFVHTGYPSLSPDIGAQRLPSLVAEQGLAAAAKLIMEIIVSGGIPH